MYVCVCKCTFALLRTCVLLLLIIFVLLLLCVSFYLRDFPLATENLSPFVVVAFVNFNKKTGIRAHLRN